MLRFLALFGLGALAVAMPATAQEKWPQRQVTLVVPFTAGGTTDIFARILADGLQAKYKQPFIVENRPGAGGNIGTAAVVRAPADGYTIMVGTISSHAINPYIYKNLSYDIEKDFQPVSLIATTPNLLVISKNVPVSNLADFIAYVKKNSGKLNFGSSGAGTSQHLSAELFALMTKTELTHVPFRSSGDTVNSLLGGHVDFAFDNITLVLPQVQGGNLRALAVTSKERSPMAPDLPTISEVLPGFEAVSWHGLFLRTEVPKAIAEQLAADVREILTKPQVVKQLTDIGVKPSPTTPAEFAVFLKAERAKWSEVAEKINLTVR